MNYIELLLKIKELSDFAGTLPNNFSLSLKRIMKYKGFSKDRLSEESGISRSTIGRYRDDENVKKGKKTLSFFVSQCG